MSRIAKRWRVLTGDCLEVLENAKENSFDSIVTDPPYHLTSMSRGGSPRQNDPKTPFGRHSIGEKGFMNATWDGGDISFDPGTWASFLRVMKPGSHLVAFGGARTYHKIASAIEEAGWELRDSLIWLYGTGFPKSKNQKGKYEGFGTQLKPAFEPIVLARKPFTGSVAENLKQWGTGAINVDACRIGIDDKERIIIDNRSGAYDGKRDRIYSDGAGARAVGDKYKSHDRGRWPANIMLDEYVAEMIGKEARFFYCAKASKREREEGLEDYVPVNVNDGRATSMDTAYQRGDTLRKNVHPTVKPIALMRWLIRLITPPGGYVLDPFCGSGSTGIASLHEGNLFVGIEKANDPKEPYVNIARARIAHWDPNREAA